MSDEAMSLLETRWSAATLLGRLSERPRRALLELGTSVRFDSGRTILREGEPGHFAYLLLHGCVKVRGNEAEWEPLLAIRIGGDLIGEMAMLSRKPRSASVLTCAETSARAIPAEELRGFLLRCPEVTLEIASILSERLRWANERRVHVAALDPRGRISRLLLTLAGNYGRPVGDGWDLGAPLTQAEIASLAGIRLPTAEKALRGFAEAGLIKLGYRSTVVLDLDALQAITQT
jgi:CRP-like cAMP-binding protein